MNVSPRRTGRSILVGMLALMLMGLVGPAATTSSAATVTQTTTMSALTFQDNMRKLWEDHVTWTRLYIVSAVAGLPETDATTQRLLDNQTDLGNAIKPYYGEAAGDQLTALLKDHILGAAAVLTAAKAGDTAGVKSASDEWYANADDIAIFLNGANPNAWPLDTLKMDMKMHLDQTLTEAVDHLQGNYAADVADYDIVHNHILAMADTISAGIISQFPDRFTALPSAAEVSLHLTMRKLWEDHVTWTRLFIVSASAGLPDLDATTQRLLANQTDLGNAVKAYYGDAAGTQLTALLRDHILGAAAVLTAAKAGDTAGLKAASDKWYANANDIAAFLNSANPAGWPLDTLKMDMKMHLDQTLAEASDHLQGNYTADVADYDVVHNHILAMADALSGGIVNQFPEQFGGSPPVAVGMPHTGMAGNPVTDMLGWALGAFGLMLVASGAWVLRKRSVHI